MIKIMKASAGSGKTYNLARTYIRILLESEDPLKYRHILAVTFTNKATDEMKRRILKELHILSLNPVKSDYYADFVPAVLPTPEALQKKSRECLCRILHDYGAFAVSTIDRFFQQTLKAFSREIGQFASYQVELDRDSLVDESVDRVLDNLSEEDRDLLDWLSESARESLEQEGRFSLENKIGAVARSLKSERLRGPLKDEGKTASEMFSRERLRALRRFCNKYISGFENDACIRAQKVVDILKGEGLTPEDFKGRTLKAVGGYALAKKGGRVECPSEAFLRDAPDSSAWFTKANQRYVAALEGTLAPAFADFCDLFGERFKAYNTAFILRGQIDGLGIARELEEQFALLLKEKNVLSIDDSNSILRDIIDGSDAPFIYEKLGVRYENFLLDEFQDTSTVQWDNFRPLITNSEAGGFENLVVGDVKQSIYRFRGSDWRLLADRLPAELPDHVPDPLEGNYRTLPEIIHFNSGGKKDSEDGFFRFAARQLGLETLYDTVWQKPCLKDDASGSVEIVFRKDVDEEMDEIVSTIRSLLDEGAEYRDIAVLVRWNTDGSFVAERLIAEGIPVVSDDSLKVKSSPLVRLTVSALSLTDNPPYIDNKGNLRVCVEGYDAWSKGIGVPSSYDSLPALAEQLLHAVLDLSEGAADGEVPYILSFMDYLQDWVSVNGNDLPGFLKAWAEDNPKVSSPASGNCVRIMTIHKSKGLEFPFVILPFVEGIPFFDQPRQNDEGYWCKPALKGTPLEGEAEGIFNVKISGTLENTYFSEDLARERELQKVDNLNIFYVAMTRAEYGLKVIGREGGSGNMSALLQEYLGAGDFRTGEHYPFSALKREEAADAVKLSYPCWPVADVSSGDSRLRISADATDFFSPEGTVGAKASPRLRGIVYHKLLSSVRVPSDLSSAVDAAVRRGEIGEEDRLEAETFLAGKLASVRDRGWFPETPEAILNEVEILDADGGSNRPDRVVVRGNEAVVVDYKFEQTLDETLHRKRQNGYLKQVRRYMALLRQLGYTSVRGYLWYVDRDEILEVSELNLV